MSHPVLLVHGIWNEGACFDVMSRALRSAGIGPVSTLDLKPNDGSVPIEALAEQVAERAGELCADHDGQLDLVGFSMGALVSRYFLQRLEGRERCRRFLSISGPHGGTATAFAMNKRGVQQMRFGSPLLRSLAADADPFGEVEVHSLWTPFDLMVTPGKTARLVQAKEEHRFPVALHRWMITDRKVVSRVVSILGRP